MGYLYLLAAIALEVVGTSLLRSTESFTRLWPSIGCAVCYVVSIAGLAAAVRTVEVGTAYAIWAGLGTALVVTIATLYLDEPLTVVKTVGLVLIVSGVVTLNLGGAH
jgi:small multidrug resistance pump